MNWLTFAFALIGGLVASLIPHWYWIRKMKLVQGRHQQELQAELDHLLSLVGDANGLLRQAEAVKQSFKLADEALSKLEKLAR